LEKQKQNYGDKDQWLPEAGAGKGINRQSAVLGQ